MSAPSALMLEPAPAAGAGLQTWLDWQLRLHPQAIELGLGRVATVADRLGVRHTPPLTLTLAGTNGKGASAVLAADCLRRAGHRVGAYTSPHLHHYNERLCVDGVPASDAEIVAAFEAIEAVRDGVSLTYFEYGTLAALWWFRERCCDVQVLEVGLGGRLDAVNLLDADAALITSIGLDHGDWLGHTRAEVAAEKAGVFRAGRAAICTDLEPPPELLRRCAQGGIPLRQLGRDFQIEVDTDGWRRDTDADGWRWPLPALPGTHACRNAAGVFELLDAVADRAPVSVADRAAALQAWQLPGRCQRRGRYLLDVGHNAEAAAALVPVLRTQPGPLHAVLGMLDDKPVEAVAQALAPCLSRSWAIGLPPPRGLPASVLAERLGQGGLAAQVAPDMSDALRRAAQGAGTVLVCGSFLTVAAADAALSACPELIDG